MAIREGFNVIERYIAEVGKRHVKHAVYRGHENMDWLPMPSAFRSGRHGILKRDDLERWKTVAARFAERNQSDLAWLVLAQHYGVPTALLDWSTNPLIALFFACSVSPISGGDKNHGAVLTMTRELMRIENNAERVSVFEEVSGMPLLVNAGTMNARSLAQDSVMTLHCKGNSVLTPGWDPRFFYVLVNEKADTLNALRTLGVSSDRIYADINTVAREFIEELLQAGTVPNPPSMQPWTPPIPPAPPQIPMLPAAPPQPNPR